MIVDLNADLGEGFGSYRIGEDRALLDIVTSANVACGFHAGDPEIMAETFHLARARGVTLGAHPGFPDLWGFGRRQIPFSSGEIERMIAYQIGAAQALATYSGASIAYVKCHGALANLCERDRGAARAAGRAMKAVDARLIWLTIAAGEQVLAAQDLDIPHVIEVFADRGYDSSGRLAPRGTPGALIEDVEAAAARVADMAKSQAIFTLEGGRIPTAVGSVCVHGDNPQAVARARAVRAALEAAGVVVKAFA